jgi:flagellar basal body-associated protein FliL
MSEEPKKDVKTTAEGAASAAPGAAEAQASASSGAAAQEAEKVAGKDEGKKKDEDKNRKKEDEKKKDKNKDKSEKKDEKKDKDKDEKKGKDSGEKQAPGLPFNIPESAILAAAIVVSLTAGSLLGCLLIAPRVIAARNAQPAAPARAEKAEGGGEAQESEGKKGEGKKGEGKKGEGEKSAVFSIDNIVVNPAGSAGTRFLMASVAFELPDEKAVEALREKEVQIRDAVITTLESQTLEMLAAPGSREGIKRQLAIAIKPLVPGQKQPRVYLPQFVLQ